MFWSAVHLLEAAATLAINWIGTAPLAIAVQICAFGWPALSTLLREGRRGFLDHLKKIGIHSLGFIVSVWLITFLVAAFQTIYRDHVDSRNEISSLRSQLARSASSASNASQFSDDADSVVATGTTQATASPVSALYNVIISAAPKSGVILSPMGHRPITIKNISPVVVSVYPPFGAAFPGLKINQPSGLYMTNGEDTFVCVTETKCTN